MIYFDSAYIAKFYLAEPDSEPVRVLAKDEGDVGCSVIGRAEVAQVFHRKFREQAIARSEMRALFAQFGADCAAGLWRWFPVTDGLIDDVVAAFRRGRGAVLLRTADAIHLATAGREGARAVYSNDRRMLEAGRSFRLSVRTVSG